MRKISVLLIALMSPCLSYAVDPPTFPGTFARELSLVSNKGVCALDPGLRRGAGRDILFVSGIFNGPTLGYFTENRDVALQDLGARSVSMVHPWSHRTVTDNADRLYRYMVNKYGQNSRSLVLIGHSKGGIEALLAVLRHPDLVTQGPVEKIVTLQSSLQGSALAVMSLAAVAANQYPYPVLPVVTAPWRKATISTTPGVLLPQMRAGIADLNDEERAAIHESLYYVRSMQAPSKRSPTTRVMDAQSDGLIRTDEQKLDEIGTDLGVIDSDHVDTVIAKPASNEPVEFRRALMRALFREIYKAEQGPPQLPMVCAARK